jgi:hypothetical protein
VLPFSNDDLVAGFDPTCPLNELNDCCADHDDCVSVDGLRAAGLTPPVALRMAVGEEAERRSCSGKFCNYVLMALVLYIYLIDELRIVIFGQLATDTDKHFTREH